MATSPLPSQGPTCKRNCYATPAFSGVPKKEFKKGPYWSSGEKPLRGVLKGVLNKKEYGSQRTALIRIGPQVGRVAP